MNNPHPLTLDANCKLLRISYIYIYIYIYIYMCVCACVWGMWVWVETGFDLRQKITEILKSFI